ncbi:MAG: AMP-binding protein [Myxococcales bacterium]|nr:AMP-binding protein [Myxococcales bacterium]
MSQEPTPPAYLATPMDAYRVGMTPALTALKRPELPAVISEQGNRSFGELNARANQLARALRAAGLKAGDAVALMCSNRPEFVEVYCAIFRAGMRMTSINWHLQADEAAYIVENCDAKAFVADVRSAATAAAIGKALPDSLFKLAVGGPIEGFVDYEEALAGHSADNIEDPSMGSTMLYTSGTTGRPKGVTRQGAQAAAVDRQAAATSGNREAVPLKSGESMVLCTGPLYHAAPFAFNLTAPIHRGVGVVLMDKWDAEETLCLIERHRVTHTHMVSTMFHRILALPESTRARYDVSSLQRVLHGAAPTPVHVKQAMIDWLGPIVHEYYAGTEGGGTAITPEEWLEKKGSVGRPNAGRVIEILDDDGNVLPTGQVGRVFFHAPKVGRFEYYKDEGKTESAYDGNRFTLGDHGYLDEDGYLFLTGRTSEVIISGGVNIYPAEIDAALLMHPAVADVAAVGVPNDEFGEEVKGVVMLAQGYEASEGLAKELIEFASEKLARFKRPRSIDFVEDLPRSDAGKVYRGKVRARYWDGRQI